MVNSPGDRPRSPAIASCDVVLATPFFRVMAKHLDEPPRGEPYYSLDQLDYVSIVAVTSDGSLVLVRQFRPAVEAMTLELPAGHVELGQSPEDAARAELIEETGFKAENLRRLGCLRPDTGRLANRMWVYFADAGERSEGWRQEPGLEVVVATPAEFSGWLRDGAFDHALHVASFYLAVQAGCLRL